METLRDFLDACPLSETFTARGTSELSTCIPFYRYIKSVKKLCSFTEFDIKRHPDIARQVKYCRDYIADKITNLCQFLEMAADVIIDYGAIIEELNEFCILGSKEDFDYDPDDEPLERELPF